MFQNYYTVMRKLSPFYRSLVPVVVATVAASGQSFQVQCPASTITHPSKLHNNNSKPVYIGSTTPDFLAGSIRARPTQRP